MHNDFKSLTIASRISSFRHALAGIAKLIRQEPNIQIHLLATVAAVVLGFVMRLDSGRWIALVFAIALVWITEALNTALEMLCDLVCDNKYHPVVKVIKDIAAAAVFIASLASMVIGILIFIN